MKTKLESQINIMTNETIVLMADNPNIGVKPFMYTASRVEFFKKKYLRRLQLNENISSILNDFAAQLAFLRVFAVGKTKQMNTGEFTEE